MTRPKIMCLVVLSCAEISDEGRKELEETVVALKKGAITAAFGRWMGSACNQGSP